ncbi:MAG: DUF4861 domain-containing protein [Tannerellaceae bacterium]|nr:DUF4861 domain-containing protein [Tannerellaceae bacterium]
MKKAICLLLTLLAWACTQEKVIRLKVANPSAFERSQEMIALDMEALKGLTDRASFLVLDAKGEALPYQLTYDNKLIFQVSIPANATADFSIRSGAPAVYDTLVYGRQYPERLDDIAWENDRIAFRTYGPALQASGERAFGYDIWVKKVADRVVEDRYYQELVNGVSYHTDHGNGLDYYSVGPTLGAGASALLANDSLLYPYCYQTYEILDNGPLRFTLRLTYHPLQVGEDSAVVETRLLSLDAGSQMNKVSLSYDGLSRKTPLATGIVIHEPSLDYQADASEGYIAYADPADPVNGQIYAGAVFPSGAKEAKVLSGHVLALNDYTPGTAFTYYWGAGWSQWGFPASADWFAYVKAFAQKLKTPLVVSIQ